MSFYTYAARGLGVMPDTVTDYDTVEDAVIGFFSEVETTCEHMDADLPADLPAEDDVIDAITAGTGLAYAAHGWIHAVGVD